MGATRPMQCVSTDLGAAHDEVLGKPMVGDKLVADKANCVLHGSPTHADEGTCARACTYAG